MLLPDCPSGHWWMVLVIVSGSAARRHDYQRNALGLVGGVFCCLMSSSYAYCRPRSQVIPANRSRIKQVIGVWVMGLGFCGKSWYYSSMGCEVQAPHGDAVCDQESEDRDYPTRCTLRFLLSCEQYMMSSSDIRTCVALCSRRPQSTAQSGCLPHSETQSRLHFSFAPAHINRKQRCFLPLNIAASNRCLLLLP